MSDEKKHDHHLHIVRGPTEDSRGVAVDCDTGEMHTFDPVDNGTDFRGKPIYTLCEDGKYRLAPGAVKPGPAQVATKDYREGWDRIFGGQQVRGQA